MFLVNHPGWRGLRAEPQEQNRKRQRTKCNGRLFQVFVYHIKTCASKDEKDRAKCAMVAIIHYRRAEEKEQCKEI